MWNICNGAHYVAVSEIQNSLKKLQYDKHDRNSGFSTSHLLYGSDTLNVFLSFLLSSIMQHGYTPVQMSTSTIIPIPKNCRKSLNDSDNYRGIALSSPIGKMFDCILINANTEELKSSDFQFGYKENSSTAKCTFVVKEIINYYNTNGSEVYVILLDV